MKKTEIDNRKKKGLGGGGGLKVNTFSSRKMSKPSGDGENLKKSQKEKEEWGTTSKISKQIKYYLYS